MKKFLLVAAMFVSVSMFAQSPLKKMTKVDVNPLTERTVTKAQTTRISTGMAKAKANAAEKNAPNYYLDYVDCAYNTPIRDKIAISCMLRQIHEFSSHAIRHGLYIKNRKRLFCP